MTDEGGGSKRRLPLVANASVLASTQGAGAQTGQNAPALEPEVRRIDRRRPVYAVWELTLRCDLACQHCGSRAGHARENELSTAECLDVVAQLAALGIKEVTLIGGE